MKEADELAQDRARRKALALEREKEKNKTSTSYPGNPPPSLFSKIELEQQEHENGFTIENTAKSFWNCSTQLCRNDVKLTEEEEKNFKSSNNISSKQNGGVLDNPIVSAIATPVTLPLNFFFPPDNDDNSNKEKLSNDEIDLIMENKKKIYSYKGKEK